jgi:hypothetical protein
MASYYLDSAPSTGSGAGMYVTNAGNDGRYSAVSGGGKTAASKSPGISNQSIFAASAGISAGFARTDAIVEANNELAYYYSIVQEAMNNQTVTFIEGLNVGNAGIEAQKKVRRRSIHEKGAVRTGYAGRNIRINTGSPVDIIHSVNVIEAEERRLIHENTELAQDALELKRLNFKRQEDAARNKAATINPSARGNQAFMGSLLSSAGSFAAAGGFG